MPNFYAETYVEALQKLTLLQNEKRVDVFTSNEDDSKDNNAKLQTERMIKRKKLFDSAINLQKEYEVTKEESQDETSKKKDSMEVDNTELWSTRSPSFDVSNIKTGCSEPHGSPTENSISNKNESGNYMKLVEIY